MAKRTMAAVAGLGIAALLISACGSSSTPSSGSSAAASKTPTAKIGVILPSSANSARWEAADRVFLKRAFDAAGVKYDIQNANDDKAKFSTIADQMLSSGVTALMIVNLDSDTGAAVIKKANAQGVQVIDYDRLTLGGKAAYYVSFDNVAVGTGIGSGLVKCLNEAGTKKGPVALLNGAPTDNNATLFRQGYKAALESAGFTVTADQAVADWDNTKAGTIFEQMYTKAKGDFVGAAAANDGLAGAAIAVLDRTGQAGKIFVSGQDATDEGLQRVLLGTQCMSVYKAVNQEAGKAAALAIALSNGDTAGVKALITGTTKDSVSGAEVPSLLLLPKSIFPANVKDVVADGYTTAARLCTTDKLKAACTKYGVK